MEQTIRIVYPTKDAAEEAARFYAAQRFDVAHVCAETDVPGWVVEAFRPDIEVDGLWTAARLTAFRD
jgi:hypothetical protein